MRITKTATIYGHSLILGATLPARITLPSGSVNVDTITFAFDHAWNNYTSRTAAFWVVPSSVYHVPLVDNVAVIPHETLASPALVHMAVFATGNGATICTNDVVFEVEQGAYTANTAPPPTPSVYEQLLAAIEGKQDEIAFDDTPMDGSSNPVKSNGIYAALINKQNLLLFDKTPTIGSSNPVTSGGVHTALSEKLSANGDGSALTANTPQTIMLLEPLFSGDTLSRAYGVINRVVGAIEDLDADKLTANGDGSVLTVRRGGASVDFADIPFSAPITLQNLLQRLGGWYLEINNKQDELTFDAVPTANSVNPVTSGGVHTALSEKLSANGDGSAITVNAPLDMQTLEILLSGDTLSRAYGVINRVVGAIEDLDADKLTANGDGSVLTVRRGGASVNFADIPVSDPITLQNLLQRLGGWYSEINAKQRANQTATITLPAGGWNATTKTQTVAVTGMTSTALVICDGDAECTGQDANSLTFAIADVPQIDITVKVGWFV